MWIRKLSKRNSEYIFLEGYPSCFSEGYDTFKEAITQAKKYNTKVALSLSDDFIVKSFKKELLELIEINCDLIFSAMNLKPKSSPVVLMKRNFSYFKNYS